MTTSRMSSSFSVSITAACETLAGSSGSLPPPRSPTARTLCDWVPSVRMSPPTLAFERAIASSTCCHRHAVLLEQPGIEEHLILLDGPAVAGHVDDARDLLEERVQHPILDGLELVRRVARALEDVADDLARSGSRARGRA